MPKGKVSNLMGIINLLLAKYDKLEIKLSAKEGSMSQQEFEDKIVETFRQLNIDCEEK